MRSRVLTVRLLAALIASTPTVAAASTPDPDGSPSAVSAGEEATFAGGCFWCMETAFEGLKGVESVVSGYTGGQEKNPTYEQVSSKSTGHAESVLISFDPREITYARLLDVFWHNVDPTDAEGQFCDRGPEYRSEIFYHDAAQKQLAEESKKKIEGSPHRFKQPIVTAINPATEYWPAEEYHQDYYKKDPIRYHSYRLGCGRDLRLIRLWGKPGRQGHASAK